MPSAPTNGEVEVKGRKPGSVAHFTCDEGYSMPTDTSQTCGNDLEWTGTQPECISEYIAKFIMSALVNNS